jgi:3-oxoadipate enol-lactonase
MPLLSQAGRRISYLDTGALPLAPGAAPRALLLLHAFPLNCRMWEPQLAAVPAGWRFLAPDLRGFGQSDGDEDGSDVSIEEYAADALDLLDHLGIDRWVVAGLSMGGYAAFALLRLAAGRVAGLVLADTRADADSAEVRNGRFEMVTLLHRQGVPAVVDRMVPRLLCEQTRRERPEVEERVRTLAGMNSAEGVGTALIRMMQRPDSTALLPRITCPTLVIAGDQDAATPPDQARAMQQRITGARFAGIPGAGHLSNLEQPEAFNAALHQFLTAL